MRSLFLLPVVALWLLAWGPPANAGEYVVISAEGTADYSPGEVLEDSVPLSLPDGANLTLIGSDGLKVSIEGPYSETIGAGAGGTENAGGESGDGAGNLVASLSRLFSSAGTDATGGASFVARATPRRSPTRG